MAIPRKIAKQLVGLSADFPENADVWQMQSFRINSADLPVPALVLLLLRNIMGCPWSNGGEKVRWTVYATFLDEPVAFELGKFGFSLRWRKGVQIDHKRLIGQLQSAVSVMEKELALFAEHQVSEGRVTLVNHYGEFGARYQFFRALAKKAYRKSQRVSDKAKRNGSALSDIAFVLNATIAADREGFFHSAAMVDAYFSFLEHRLILLRAFTGRPLESGEFKKLLTARWDEKFKLVAPEPGKRPAELIVYNLKTVKERIRNPFAHGGVENDGGSQFFHMPTLGAIPLNLGKVKNSIRFDIGFIPIPAASYESICATFDEADAFLKEGPLEGPSKLLEAGVDPSFDIQSLSNYAAAVSGDSEQLDDYIYGWCRAWEAHANFEM